MTDVLPGFEDEVAAQEAARAAQIEARRLAASDPTVTGPDSGGRYTLIRTHPWEDIDGQPHKAVTVIFSAAEWTIIEATILADLGLHRATRP